MVYKYKYSLARFGPDPEDNPSITVWIVLPAPSYNNCGRSCLDRQKTNHKLRAWPRL